MSLPCFFLFEMLSLVGLGVAMGNANPPARIAANVVVGTNDEDGVAEAVQSYVLDQQTRHGAGDGRAVARCFPSKHLAVTIEGRTFSSSFLHFV